MEKIYSAEKNACNLVKASPDTVRFLLSYSKSLRTTKYKQFIFESNMN